MKNKVLNILITLIFLAGFAILVYPAAANFWNQQREKQLINTYEEAAKKAEAEDLSAIFEAAYAYNKAQLGNAVPDAFAEGESTIDEQYESLLNYNGDGIMCYLEIPCIDVQIPVFHGTGEAVLQKGAGHLEGSSLPVGGESTHAVMAAHRGLPSSALFTDLNLLKEGDLFFIHVLDQVLAYEVESNLVVEPHETESLLIQYGEDLVTLVTCTPYGVNSHRILVRGHRVEYTQEVREAAKEVTFTSITTNYELVVLIGLAFVAVVGVLLFLAGKCRDRKRRRKLAEAGKNASVYTAENPEKNNTQQE